MKKVLRKVGYLYGHPIKLIVVESTLWRESKVVTPRGFEPL